MISVVIPLYNKEKQIRATLESVLAQSFSDYEIVIVNDGSTDRSVEEAAAVNDPRIRLIHQENAGVSAARNRGIEEAKGEFIAFLDADDRWKPEYLQTQYELTKLYPECSVFACNYEFVDAQGQVKPAIIRKLPFAGEHGMLSNYFEVASCSHPPICSISIMVRKEAIQSINGFPLCIKSGEDLLTWARLACQYKISYSRKICAQYVLLTSSSAPPPSDLGDVNDAVSLALRLLFASYDHDVRYKQMITYLAFWYKMRARINLSLGNRKAARKCALTSAKRRLTFKALILIVLTFMPTFIIRKIFK